MEGVALNEFRVVALSAGLHGGDRVAGFQYIFAVFIEQGKGRVEGRGLFNGSRFRLGKRGADPDEGGDREEQSNE